MMQPLKFIMIKNIQPHIKTWTPSVLNLSVNAIYPVIKKTSKPDSQPWIASMIFKQSLIGAIRIDGAYAMFGSL